MVDCRSAGKQLCVGWLEAWVASSTTNCGILEVGGGGHVTGSFGTLVDLASLLEDDSEVDDSQSAIRREL